MSGDEPAEPEVKSAPVPFTKRFRKKAPSTLPTREQLRRQDTVLRCAWRIFGASAPVIAFLNTHDERLGGRPLYLALESDEGLLRVEGLLQQLDRQP
jgi:hypothetical protein